MPLYSITTTHHILRHNELIIEAATPEEACCKALRGDGDVLAEVFVPHEEGGRHVSDIHQIAHTEQPFYEGLEVPVPSAFRKPSEYNETLSEAATNAVGNHLDEP